MTASSFRLKPAHAPEMQPGGSPGAPLRPGPTGVSSPERSHRYLRKRCAQARLEDPVGLRGGHWLARAPGFIDDRCRSGSFLASSQTRSSLFAKFLVLFAKFLVLLRPNRLRFGCRRRDTSVVLRCRPHATPRRKDGFSCGELDACACGRREAPRHGCAWRGP
jgi:hypothetical protein